ncbi:ABC transporter permease DevC [Planctomyces sp. SH-PL62]|uniref:ABC transporter permease DevC n=1 Tax=Planctomyces sp. SH-PL62 TaxID=1636152 RepID=UPI00078CE3FE|nr:ABC transporter permease DevC [Planctomyces sp. SH-PL62]AMV36740.1 FtsX-like permease family protein [Planctomyces sp. SH-PL62]
MQPGRNVHLAWRNLTEHKLRLLASVAGVAFATTLMFMENGFRKSILDSMVNVIERIDGQVVIVSRTLYTLSVPFPFPLERIVQARDVPDVASTSPLYTVTRSSYWRNPETNEEERICVVGYPPEDDLLDVPELKAARALWSRPNTAMADERSREQQFGVFREGQVSELSGRRFEIVGTFSLGINVQTNGNLVVSDRNMMTAFPELDGPSLMDRKVQVGVVRIRPGADPRRVCDALTASLPPDVRVLTLDQFIARERDFWDKVAPIGTVFYIGVVMGFIVGSVICYQVLYSDVSDRLPEFATLKAIGYSNFALYRVVMTQALYLALLGYAAGLVVSFFLFQWVQRLTGLPMDVSRNNPYLILALTVAMCLGSGLYAARRLISADPAQLFA